MPFFIGEEMENEMLIVNFCWFVAGAMTYKLLIQILSLNNAKRLYVETLIMCLKLCQAMDESYKSITELKYETQKANNIEDDAILAQKQLDENFQNFWRQVLIGTIITFCPKDLRGLLKFKDWDSAMQLIKK